MGKTAQQHEPIIGVEPQVRGSVKYALTHPKALGVELLAGVVVALALIPEAIAFSVIAGVDPAVGLFASFIMAVTISVVGGRPAMISASTAATALVIAPVNREHGFDYLIATVILAGLLQMILGGIGVANLMRFIPRSVMIGFVNALAILVFMSQLPELTGVPWMVYPVVLVGLVIIFTWPLIKTGFTQAIPAPLIAIIVITIAAVVFGWNLPTVGDKGDLPRSLPQFFLPDVPLNLETLSIIGLPALAMAVVGLLESLMTSTIIDDVTETESSKTRESLGQGIANFISGCFGTIGGCAVVGQTMMNVKAAGARTRLSTFFAGFFVLGFSVVASDLVGMIPMAALVAVMIFVSYTAFDWHSIQPSTLRIMPVSETLIMIITVVFTVATGNLAIGVGAGVLTAMISFARKVAHFVTVTKLPVTPPADETEVSATDSQGIPQDPVHHYQVTGQLFFASSNDFYTLFDYAHAPKTVVIDMTEAQIWDASAIAAVDSVTDKFERHGTSVIIQGLNVRSRALRARLSGKLG